MAGASGSGIVERAEQGERYDADLFTCLAGQRLFLRFAHLDVTTRKTLQIGIGLPLQIASGKEDTPSLRQERVHDDAHF